MLCTAPTIRTAALSCRLQPSLIASSNLHTSSTSPRTESSHTSTPLLKRNVIFNHEQSKSIRNASTTALPNTSQPLNDSFVPAHLTWNDFFKLRKTRRWYRLGSSVGTSFTSFAASTQVLINSDMDFILSQIPQIDPMIALGLMTFAAGGAGWLAGPFVGSGVFNLRNRKYKTQMAEKEKEFFKRVKKFRVDPSNSSLSNPVPDYYGEKISSVTDYRRWLKDQRAFNKKRQTYV